MWCLVKSSLLLHTFLSGSPSNYFGQVGEKRTTFFGQIELARKEGGLTEFKRAGNTKINDLHDCYLILVFCNRKLMVVAVAVIQLMHHQVLLIQTSLSL